VWPRKRGTILALDSIDAPASNAELVREMTDSAPHEMERRHDKGRIRPADAPEACLLEAVECGLDKQPSMLNGVRWEAMHRSHMATSASDADRGTCCGHSVTLLPHSIALLMYSLQTPHARDENTQAVYDNQSVPAEFPKYPRQRLWCEIEA